MKLKKKEDVQELIERARRGPCDTSDAVHLIDQLADTVEAMILANSDLTKALALAQKRCVEWAERLDQLEGRD